MIRKQLGSINGRRDGRTSYKVISGSFCHVKITNGCCYAKKTKQNKVNQFKPLLVLEQESKFQRSTLYLYTSPKVTSPKPHLMCLAPTQHRREGLLTQSSPLLGDQSEWRPVKTDRKQEPSRGGKELAFQTEGTLQRQAMPLTHRTSTSHHVNTFHNTLPHS